MDFMFYNKDGLIAMQVPGYRHDTNLIYQKMPVLTSDGEVKLWRKDDCMLESAKNIPDDVISFICRLYKRKMSYNNDIFFEDDFEWASGYFLSCELPEDFWDMSESNKISALRSLVCYDYEDLPDDFLYKNIFQLAEGVRERIENLKKSSQI